MGKILEIIIGKAVSLDGDIELGIDDQNFGVHTRDRMKVVQNILAKHGFKTSGKEMFVDGRTGETIQCPVLCGIVSYAKLTHMVSRKIHYRSTGPVNILTRQPTEGRRVGGGLRFGLMEAECLIAHSASHTLQERMYEASDKFACHVCSNCGYLAYGNDNIGYYYCKVCESREFVQQLDISYSTKLLIQELNSMNIKVKMECE